MRQYSTSRAQAATNHSAEPSVPPPPPTSSTSAREGVTALHGVMTGLANLVNEQLGRLAIGPQATRFLRHLERQTFGNAGLHRRAGRHDPGLWCPYVHAEWAAALELSTSALTHLRTRLVESGILWYTPDPQRRGGGAVGWSFDFAAWQPPQWGGARRGAGRPCAAPSAEPNTTSVTITNSAPSIQDVNEAHIADRPDEIKMSTNQFQDVNEMQSRRQRAHFKMSTKHRDDATPAQESAVPTGDTTPPQEWNQEEKKKRRRIDADASGVTSTPRGASAATDLSLDSSPHADALPRTARPPRAHAPPGSATSVRPIQAADEQLPPTLPYETLRSYWLRIYREASATTGTEARSIVHAAARALVGMGSARADFVLLGQLRQAAGNWATVLHWLLECGARELADPRSYLRAIATRQHARPSQRALAHHSDQQPARSSTGESSLSHQPDRARAPDEPPPHPEIGQLDVEEKAVAGVPGDALITPASTVPEETAADPLDLSACVSAASLWQMARQRLRADVSAAQYTSWLVGTDLVRAPDDSYLLLTRTTFAAEHISRLWGQRIAWILREITGHPCILTAQRRRPDVVPDR